MRPTRPAGTTIAGPSQRTQAEPSEPLQFERRRTGWDIVFGVRSVFVGIIALGHVTLAGAISVLFLGWKALIGGVMLAIGALVAWEDAARRWDLALGALLVLLGLGFVRNPAVAC